MRIAFYAPLKSPDHPVPSGDRQMARLLMRGADAVPDIRSNWCRELRSFLPNPADAGHARQTEARGGDRTPVDGLAAQAARPISGSAITPITRRPTCIGPRARAPASASPMSPPRPPGRRAATSAPGRPRRHWCWRALAPGGAQHLLHPARPRRPAPLRRRGRLAMLPPFIDTAPFRPRAGGSDAAQARHGGDDAAGRQARELPHARRGARTLRSTFPGR